MGTGASTSSRLIPETSGHTHLASIQPSGPCRTAAPPPPCEAAVPRTRSSLLRVESVVRDTCDERSRRSVVALATHQTCACQPAVSPWSRTGPPAAGAWSTGSRTGLHARRHSDPHLWSHRHGWWPLVPVWLLCVGAAAAGEAASRVRRRAVGPGQGRRSVSAVRPEGATRSAHRATQPCLRKRSSGAASHACASPTSCGTGHTMVFSDAAPACWPSPHAALPAHDPYTASPHACANAAAEGRQSG